LAFLLGGFLSNSSASNWRIKSNAPLEILQNPRCGSTTYIAIIYRRWNILFHAACRMNWKAARLTISTAILAFAAVLAVWGIYKIVTFGESIDNPLFYISDGPPALFWGCVLLLIGYFMRFRFRLHALSIFAVAYLSMLVLGEIKQSKPQFWAEFFYVLLAVCAAILVLVSLDRYIQRVYDFIRHKTLNNENAPP
jgi:hypothetical protein